MPDAIVAPVVETPAVEAAPVIEVPAVEAAPVVDAPVVDPAPKPLADWATLRTEIAGGDDKILKRLERYSSPKDVAEALIAAQNKIASGTGKTALPADATPEQLKDWRMENGIPETPDGYQVKLPDGLIVGAADKPMVDGFLKTAHDSNMAPAQVDQALGWYFKQQEQAMEALQAKDAAGREQGIEALRTEWGSEYKLNLGIVDGLLNTAPKGVKDALLGGRLADGTPLGNNPDVLRWLATMGREINPVATVTGQTGIAAGQAIAGRKAEIETMMRDRSSTSPYWHGTQSEAIQKEYRDLLDVEAKMRK